MTGRPDTGDPESVRTIGELLRERRWMLGLAESCTGGLVMARITDVPGSSSYFAGGIVAYADRVKLSELGVSRSLLSTYGAVSAEVATAMAQGIRSALQVEVGAAVTGIAGPGGGMPGKPVGTVWFAISLPDLERVEERRLSGDRNRIRTLSVDHCLDLLRRGLEEAHGAGEGDRTPENRTGR